MFGIYFYLEWCCIFLHVYEKFGCSWWDTIPMLAVGILFAVDVFRDKIKFGLPETKWHKYLTISLIAWALGLYTLAGWLTGHPYPGGPLPVAPCPMTIFAIALVSTSMKTLKTDRILFILLFILLLWWAFFAGLGAPFKFGFYVDLTLFAAGVYGLVMFYVDKKKDKGIVL